MLKKEQLEKLLERCMASSCDFAEIFEEEGTTESLSMLNGKLEDTNVLIRAGIGIRLYKVCNLYMDIQMKQVKNH